MRYQRRQSHQAKANLDLNLFYAYTFNGLLPTFVIEKVMFWTSARAKLESSWYTCSLPLDYITPLRGPCPLNSLYRPAYTALSTYMCTAPFYFLFAKGTKYISLCIVMHMTAHGTNSVYLYLIYVLPCKTAQKDTTYISDYGHIVSRLLKPN